LQQGVEDVPFVISEKALDEYSVMAYTNGQRIYFGQKVYHPLQPMIYDIMALQHLYGTNTTTRNTDTRYDFTGEISKFITIYDTGGIDILDFNNPGLDISGIVLDLNPGTRSTIGTNADNWSFFIANDVIIENAIGTKLADTIRGNDADNVLQGLGDQDPVGASGKADILDGRGGNDTASYSMSPQGVSVDLALRQQSTSNNGHASGDTLISIENLIGSRHNDTLKGNNDHNRLEGGGGNDTLTGGGGKDIFVVQFGTGKGLDTITDFQTGVDILVLQVAQALANFIAAAMSGAVTVTKPDDNDKRFDFRMEGSSVDGLNLQFTEVVGETPDFGGEEHLQIEVV
jgi:Ca2+-binding RTX toxin-like protein